MYDVLRTDSSHEKRLSGFVLDQMPVANSNSKLWQGWDRRVAGMADVGARCHAFFESYKRRQCSQATGAHPPKYDKSGDNCAVDKEPVLVH